MNTDIRRQNTGTMPNRSLNWWTGIAIAALLGVRLFYAFVYVPQVNPDGHLKVGGDAADFLQIAWTLKETGHYGTPKVNGKTLDVLTPLLEGDPLDLPPNTEVTPKGWRPPLWTAVLAVWLAFSGGSMPILLLLRFLLDALTLWLLSRLLARTGWAPLPCVATLLLTALHPVWLLYSNTWLSEPLTLFMLVALANATIAFRQRPAWRTAALLGIASGLLVLCHPLFLFAAFGSIAWAGAARLALGLDRTRVPLVVFAAGCCVLIVGAWVVRNAIVLNHVSLTTSSSHVLAIGWSETFLDTYNNTTAEVRLPKGPGPVAFVRDNWAAVPRIVVRKVAGALGPRVETKRAGILELGRAGWWLLSFVPVWLCLLKRGMMPNELQAVLRIQVGGYLLMTVLTYPAIRFRAPLLYLDVLAVVATGIWAVAALARYRARRRRG